MRSASIRKWLKTTLPTPMTRALQAMTAEYRREREIAIDVRRFGRHAAATLQVRRFAELFPPVGGEIVLPLDAARSTDTWELPGLERCTLAAIVRSVAPARVFEFGTYLGASTLLMAMNAPPHAKLTTLDLDPARREAYFRVAGVQRLRDFETGVLFKATPVAPRIHQRYGDSGEIDFSEYAKSIDLVFVDGDHSYAQVGLDTRAALQMLKPGGTILWDDYTTGTTGVVRCLNELAQRVPLVRIEGTRFVIYRSC